MLTSKLKDHRCRHLDGHLQSNNGHQSEILVTELLSHQELSRIEAGGWGFELLQVMQNETEKTLSAKSNSFYPCMG